MNATEQLEKANESNQLTLVEFYADWSPHYEWVEPILHEFEKQVGFIKINIEEEPDLSKKYNIEIVPTFIILQNGKNLWKQYGELDMGTLAQVIQELQSRN